jgi:hypothetical protein
MAAPDAGERIQKAEAALSAALRARGHEVEAGTAVVSGERINFRFEEVLREMQAPLTAQERRSVDKGAPATIRVLMPTSKPVLIAKPADRHGGGERRWTDKGRRLEDQMHRIVLRFEAIAQKVMDGRARAEEFDREFKASMRRAALRLQRERAEAARPRVLRALAARWAETRRLRAFLDAAETHIASAFPRQGHWRLGWTGLASMSRTSIPCPASAWKRYAPRPNIFCRFRRMTAIGTRTNRSGATWDGSTISAGSTNGTESRAAATSAGCGTLRRLLKVAANLRPRTSLRRKS